MENSMVIPQNISTYDPAILLLHVHPKELKARTQKDTCTPMLISATSHNNQRWKQSKGPQMDKQMNKL